MLPKRLAVSIKEGIKHRIAFDDFTKGLEATRPEEVAEWRQEVLKWELKTHPTKEDECPFESVESGMWIVNRVYPH